MKPCCSLCLSDTEESDFSVYFGGESLSSELSSTINRLYCDVFLFIFFKWAAAVLCFFRWMCAKDCLHVCLVYFSCLASFSSFSSILFSSVSLNHLAPYWLYELTRWLKYLFFLKGKGCALCTVSPYRLEIYSSFCFWTLFIIYLLLGFISFFYQFWFWSKSFETQTRMVLSLAPTLYRAQTCCDWHRTWIVQKWATRLSVFCVSLPSVLRLYLWQFQSLFVDWLFTCILPNRWDNCMPALLGWLHAWLIGCLVVCLLFLYCYFFLVSVFIIVDYCEAKSFCTRGCFA